MKPVITAVLALAFLGAASAAHAEKWVYWPIPGGALAYDEHSRQTDVATGHTAADVLTYFFVPRAMGAKSYNIRSERLEFNCRDNRFRTLAAALFDDDHALMAQTQPTDWAATPAGTPPALFQRIFCTNARPPTGEDVATQSELRKALHLLPPTSAASTGAAVKPPAPITPPKPTP